MWIRPSFGCHARFIKSRIDYDSVEFHPDNIPHVSNTLKTNLIPRLEIRAPHEDLQILFVCKTYNVIVNSANCNGHICDDVTILSIYDTGHMVTMRPDRYSKYYFFIFGFRPNKANENQK